MSLWNKLHRRQKLQAQRQGSQLKEVPQAPVPKMRWLIRHDMPEVLDIERKSFDTLWTEECFLQNLKQRNCIGMVVELQNSIVGFIIYELHQKTLRVTNMAVHPEHRKQGIGRLMMARMVEKVLNQNRKGIVILLPDECKETRLFFKKCGYGKVVIQTTNEKGTVAFDIVLKPMKSKHVVRVQVLENRCVRKPRNIGSMLGQKTCGVVACNTRANGEIVGYALYEKDDELPDESIVMNGARGFIIHPAHFNKKIGRKLMQYVADLGKPIVLEDIDLTDKNRCRLFEDIGVPIPKFERYVTVEWNGKCAAS